MRRALWLLVVCLTLGFTSGCHLLFGDFKEGASKGAGGTAPGFCAVGEARCSNEFLLMCNADKSGFVKTDTCASKDECDSKDGHCLVCAQANSLRCNGSRLESCSDDRTSWNLKQDCGSPGMCSLGGCGPCTTPGALQCTDDTSTNTVEIRVCDATSGVWTPVTSCPNDDVCAAVLTRAQANPALWDQTCPLGCTPGQFQCDGMNLQRCPVNGVQWMPVATCTSAALCSLTLQDLASNPDLAPVIQSCDAGCGTPGALRCVNGNSLERCSADQTTWEQVLACPDGTQCTTQGQGDCIVCTPGDYQCNGATLEQCSVDRVWASVQDCKTSALCQVRTDATSGRTLGSCLPPVCPVAGEDVCGSQSAPTTPGPVLFQCSSDLTSFVQGDTCATAELCSAGDKKCNPPICSPGQRRCNPSNLLEVQSCNPGETGWNTVTTCQSGEFCDATDTAQPCKTQCPAALLCNDRFLQTCSATAGIVDKAECDTKELCACGIAGTCAAGTLDGTTSSCGKPVCSAGSYRCTDSTGAATSGSVLQQCNAGLDGWTTVKDCGSTALCVPTSTSVSTGYCAVCPLAGEVSCNGSTTAPALQTCAPDRKSWVAGASCSSGCIDNGTTDFCAACLAGEHRCSGDLVQVQVCSTDRKSLSTLSNCQFGCVNSGTNDYCGTCAVGEKRCKGSAPGSTLQTCSTDQTTLTDSATCANGCIDSGTADYCADCVPGQSQCSGTGVRVCGTNGKWGAVTACTNGTCVASGMADYCPGCAVGETRCSGSTLQQCSTDQKSLTTVQTCANGCIDSGTADYCAACTAGELRCSGSTLQQCSADQKSLATVQTCASGCVNSGTADYCAACAVGELRCNASVLQACSTDQKSLVNSQTCLNGCFDSGIADYCGDCTPGNKRCTTTGGLQTCGTDGHWPAAVACAKGCFGALPNAYCGDCTPSVDTQCGTTGTGSVCGSTPCAQSCDATGHFSTTSLTVCSAGPCLNGSCAQCTPATVSCVDSVNFETCTSSGTLGASTPCPNGACVANACADCMPTTSLCTDTTHIKTCDATGHYGLPSVCASGACTNNACTACVPGTSQCMGTSAVQACGTDGSLQMATPCANGCIDSGTADYCADCVVGSASCTDPTHAQTCGTDGHLQAATDCGPGVCLNGACVACSPGSTQCGSDGMSQATCSSAGAWGAPVPCTSGVCDPTSGKCM